MSRRRNVAVQSGALISLATAFLALVWQGLEAQQGLLEDRVSNLQALWDSSCAVLMALLMGAAHPL